MGIITGLFGHVVLVLIHLSAIMLDVALFFLVMRFLAIKWPVAFFIKFDAIGSPIVNPMLATTKKMGISHQARFLVLSLALTICRLGLGVIANSLIAGA